MGKKAQITIFMIVGIILLFSSALIFYIKNQVTEGIPAEFVPAIEEVPLEAQPIKIYTEKCLNTIAIEGLTHMGAHGGYVDPTDIQYGSKFVAGPFPTESDALAVTEDSKSLSPYWYYLKSPNDCKTDCQFSSNTPPLSSETDPRAIDKQVERFIKNNLNRCLQGYKTFEDQGFEITPKGDMDVDVKITENDVAVLLTYPIDVKKSGRSISVEQYFTKVDVKLKKMYNMALQITNFEAQRHFLANQALNLIAIYSKPVSRERIPPFSHFNFGPTGEYLFWTRTETQQRLENDILPPGMAMAQVYGAGNTQRQVIFDDEGYDGIMTGIMDKMVMSPNGSVEFGDIQARFAYLDWWPIYLNINDQEVLRPTSIGPAVAGPLFDLIGMDQYKFYYSLSFPVLTVLTDPEALDGDGFKFTFALEGNVRVNQPMNASFIGLEPVQAPSLFCDPDQLNAGPYGIEVKNAIDDTGIEDARVEFVAGEESCFVGFTERDEDNKTRIEANFPVGAGELVIVKDGYLPVRTNFGAFLDDSANFTYDMMPIFTLNATVEPLALSYEAGNKYVLPEVPISSLSPKENAMLILTRQPDEEYGEFQSFVSYNVTEGPSEVLLVPGKYEVQGFLMFDDPSNPVVLDSETKTIEVPFKDDEKVEFNRTILNPWTMGGVVMNNNTGFMEITADQLLANSKVKFKILKYPRPVTHSSSIGAGPSMDQIADYEISSNRYFTDLQPEFSQ